VVEAWNSQAAAYFSWDPLPLAARTSPRASAVVQPLADLRLAFAFGAGAAARLIKGLGALAWDVLAGRHAKERSPELNCA